MYEIGNGNKLYIPAMVRHLPSTNSIAKIRPAYVTDTDTKPSNPRNAKCTGYDNGMYSANPLKEIKNLIALKINLSDRKNLDQICFWLTKNCLKNDRPKEHCSSSKFIR